MDIYNNGETQIYFSDTKELKGESRNKTDLSTLGVFNNNVFYTHYDDERFDEYKSFKKTNEGVQWINRQLRNNKRTKQTHVIKVTMHPEFYDTHKSEIKNGKWNGLIVKCDSYKRMASTPDFNTSDYGAIFHF